MKKVFSLVTVVLITATILSGCRAKIVKNSVDVVSTSSQSLDATGPQQEATVIKGADTVSSATKSDPASNNKESIEEEIGGYYTAKPINMLQEDWLTRFAGDKKNAITVKIAKIINKGSLVDSEPCLELQGSKSAITLVANNIHY